jgi:hypothetical protein
MDRLIFLATRYVQSYGGVKVEDLPQEEARLTALRDGDRPDIERWWRDPETGQMNVVIRGLHSNRSKKGRGQIISPYYFRIDDFDPFTGGKKHAAETRRPILAAGAPRGVGGRGGGDVAPLFRPRQDPQRPQCEPPPPRTDGCASRRPLRVPERVRTPVEAWLRGHLRPQLPRRARIVQPLRERACAALGDHHRRRRGRSLRADDASRPAAPARGVACRRARRPRSASRLRLLLVPRRRAATARPHRHASYPEGGRGPEVGSAAPWSPPTCCTPTPPPSSSSPASRPTTCWPSRPTSPACWTAASVCHGPTSLSWTARATGIM